MPARIVGRGFHFDWSLFASAGASISTGEPRRSAGFEGSLTAEDLLARRAAVSRLMRAGHDRMPRLASRPILRRLWSRDEMSWGDFAIVPPPINTTRHFRSQPHVALPRSLAGRFILMLDAASSPIAARLEQWPVKGASLDGRVASGASFTLPSHG